jgi:spore coat protein CotF
MVQKTNGLSDLDILLTFEASAKAAVTAYATAAAQAYDPAIRTKFAQLADLSLTAQKQARDMILKFGGTA